MTQHEPTQAEAGKRPTGRGILCSKCEHLNEAHSSKCKRCGAHLFITCNSCGKSNPRSHGRCSECDHRLHKSLVATLKKKFMRGRFRNVSLFHIAILVVAVFFAYQVIIRFASRSGGVPVEATPN
jgi:hypothetical protein